MPIRASPNAHQRAAFEFAMQLFGMMEGDDENASEDSCPMQLVQSGNLKVFSSQAEHARTHFSMKGGDHYEHFQQ
jgi:hypothetical protein